MSTVTIIEFVTGIARNFPTTMTAASLIGGLALGQLPWVIMGAGGIVVGLLILCLQAFIGAGDGAYWTTKTPDIAVLQACSLIPIGPTPGVYSYVPSLWFALTAYYVTYIFMNAQEVYSAPATKLPQEALPVQHRKSIGMVSMIAVMLLFVSLAVFRLRTGCERSGILSLLAGPLFGVVLGAIAAWGLRQGASSKRDPSVGDIHGVMIGLQPGSLRTHPLACAPRASSS